MNSGADQYNTTFHVKLSKESLMRGFLKENSLYTCEAVAWGWTGLLSKFCPELHHLALGSQAGGKTATQEGRKTGLELHFWLIFYQVS